MKNLLFTTQSHSSMRKTNLNKKELIHEIELKRLKADSYIDAILTVCEERALEPEDIASLLGPIITAKLETECVRNKLIDGVQVNSLEDL